VGVIPGEWRVEFIGQIAQVGRGRVISHREISASLNKTYPVYSSQTSNDGVMGFIDTFDFEGEYITWTTDGANAGTVFYRDGRFNCTNVCGTIKLKKDDPSFVSRALAGIAPRYVSRNLGNPKLMNDVVKRIPVPLPRLPEQRAIAAALSDVDALIGALDKLIAKKRDLKQAAMQQLLTGQRRLPGFHGEWEVKRLGELASVTAGGTPSRTNDRYWNGNIPWVTTSEVDFCSINCVEEFITKEGLKSSAARLLPPGTLLMALYGQGKTRGKIGVLGIEASTNQACAAISLHRGVSRDFIFHFLASRYEAIRNLSNTGNQENLNGAIVRSISIQLPPGPEQRAIAAVLSDMDAEIAALEARRDKTRALKRGMMQELLTGRIRLL
jgi:type I restriction enzyme S subunit